MLAACTITLPHGYFAEGTCHCEAEVRPLNGADEAFLLEHAAGSTTAERATALLGRCLVRVGDRSAPGSDVARALTVGDREAVILALQSLMFGDRLPCILDCPACGEPMDVELKVDDLVAAPCPDPRERYEASLGGGVDVTFRLPTGGDQEDAAREPDVSSGVRVLLERCAGRPLSRAAAEELAAVMATLDPQAETLLRVECPACEEPFSAVVDAATVLLEELAPSAARLFEEVHAIASRYHWGEREILDLEVPRRRRYLDLIGGGT